MKQPFFLGLPVLQTKPNWQSIGMHVLTIILFTALSYFLLAIGYGLIQGDKWYFIQQIEKDYLAQFVLLFVSVFMGHAMIVVVNLWMKKFYILPWLDKWFYPLGFILTYLVINEIWGL